MKLLRKISALFRRDSLDREMSDEMRHHLELQIEENLAAGMNPDEARHAAQRQFGGVEQIKEQARDVRRWAWFEHFLQNLHTAFRALRKHPGFAIITILTLALGIGANSAIFSVVNAVLLRPLPVSHPDELIVLARTNSEWPTILPFPLYLHLRDHAQSVSNLAAVRQSLRQLSGPVAGVAAEGIPVQVSAVSGNYFSVLGLAPAEGRLLSPVDDRDGQPTAAVVLSHEIWQRQFGGDPAVIGRSIQIDRVPCLITGIAPPHFRGISPDHPVDLWVPLQLNPRLDGETTNARLMQETSGNVVVIGRLAAGVARVQAETELATLFQARQSEIAARPQNQRLPEVVRQRVFGGKLEARPGLSGDNVRFMITFQPLLRVLWCVVALVLFLACANVASLLFVRGAARRRELCLRAALGAGRGRLVGQLLVEAALLAFAGGALGLLVARLGGQLLVTQVGDSAVLDFSLDLRVLAFTAGVSLLAGLVIGLVPALRFSQPDLMSVLKDENGGTSGRSRLWFSRILIVVQVAISLCLLTGAGLFVRTLQKLYAVDAGFDRNHAVVFGFSPEKNAPNERRIAAFQDMLDRLQSLPGVQSATFSMGGMGRGVAKFGIDVEGYVPAANEELTASFTMAGPRYFETLGTPLVLGREYVSHDPRQVNDAEADTEIVINEFMARKFFGTANPLGRRVHLARQKHALVVAGVCRNAKYSSLREPADAQVYLPVFEAPFGGAARFGYLNFQVRTVGDARPLAGLIQGLAKQIDPHSNTTPVSTMNQVVDNTLAQERMVAGASGAFSVLALLLTSLGLYGVLAFNVTQRTKEIGVRMALGADRSNVLNLVLKQGLFLIVVGAVLGAAAAPALTRLVANRLYGVSPFDPFTLAAAIATLFAAALLACWLPARRATKVDPFVALRHE